MIDKNQVLEFVKKNGLCVLSTVSSENKSESAVMAITVKDDFTLLMNSESNTRKIFNILVNPQVSIVIGGLNNDPSVQLDGQAKILANQEADNAREYMLSVHPELKDYFSETGKFISIKPTWARYSDFSQNPPEIIEFNKL